MCGIASVFLGGQYLYPFCCECKISNDLCGRRPMIKRVYGLCGSKKEKSLSFFYVQIILLDVGGA